MNLSLDGKIVPLSRLEKVWYPATGATKRQVLNYYRRVSEALLPHLRGRPLTLKRYPEGAQGEFFYEKRCPNYRPSWLSTARVRAIDFCEVDTLAALLWVVNLGSLELLSRRREPIRSFEIDRTLRKQFEKVRTRRGFLYLFDGGILRRAYGPTGRRPVVLWDVLVYEDQYLLGTKYSDRYDLLYGLCGQPMRFEDRSGHQLALAVAPDLWLARNFRTGLPERFRSAKGIEGVEGLMLKHPAGLLEWGTAEENNGDWQIRVRKPTKRHLI